MVGVVWWVCGVVYFGEVVRRKLGSLSHRVLVRGSLMLSVSEISPIHRIVSARGT